MSARTTAAAAANIAFIKYWGIRDEERIIPHNPSISMTLDRCLSYCTAEARDDGGPTEVWLASEEGELSPALPGFAAGVEAHVARLGEWAGSPAAMRVAARNTFPTGAGLASSAAGFTALTVAVLGALGKQVSDSELSVLARLSGSGSAARSVLGGYVEWPAGAGDDEQHAVALAPPEHWDLRNVIAIVDPTPKSVSSRDGHRLAPTSPYYERRQQELPERLERVREAIASRSIEALGPVIEKDAVELHMVAMSSESPIYYWQPGTLAALEAARQLREDGVEVYFTIDAGPNVHLICRPQDEAAVVERVEGIEQVESIIRDRVGGGPVTLEEHLF